MKEKYVYFKILRAYALLIILSKQHVPPDFYDNMNFDVFSNLYNEGKKTYISRF